MIYTLKKRSRSFFIKTSRFTSKFLLKLFSTSNLVLALEARPDVCTTVYIEPHKQYSLLEQESGHSYKQHVDRDGPAIILVVED